MDASIFFGGGGGGEKAEKGKGDRINAVFLRFSKTHIDRLLMVLVRRIVVIHVFVNSRYHHEITSRSLQDH